MKEGSILIEMRGGLGEVLSRAMVSEPVGAMLSGTRFHLSHRYEKGVQVFEDVVELTTGDTLTNVTAFSHLPFEGKQFESS